MFAELRIQIPIYNAICRSFSLPTVSTCNMEKIKGSIDWTSKPCYVGSLRNDITSIQATSSNIPFLLHFQPKLFDLTVDQSSKFIRLEKCLICMQSNHHAIKFEKLCYKNSAYTPTTNQQFFSRDVWLKHTLRFTWGNSS